MQIDAWLVENCAVPVLHSNPFTVRRLTNHAGADSARGGGGDERVRRNTFYLHDGPELFGKQLRQRIDVIVEVNIHTAARRECHFGDRRQQSTVGNVVIGDQTAVEMPLPQQCKEHG